MNLLQTIWLRDGERVVAFGPDGEVTLAEGAAAASNWRGPWPVWLAPDRPGMRWALCFDDSLLFTQALLACALGGHRAILPGHQRLAGLQALQSQLDGLLTDGELPGTVLTAAQLRLPLLAVDEERRQTAQPCRPSASISPCSAPAPPASPRRSPRPGPSWRRSCGCRWRCLASDWPIPGC